MAAKSVGLNMRENEPQWILSPPEEIGALRRSNCLIALANLQDPVWSAATRVTPTDEDIADARRPAAGVRDFFLPRRALSRWLAGARAGVPPSQIRVSYDADGAPRVVSDHHSYLSVAARGSQALVGAAKWPIGVDLEPIGVMVDPPETVLSQSEIAFIRGLNPPLRHLAFLKIWTMKESYLKALGSGLKRDPSAISIEQIDANAPLLRDRGRIVHAGACGWRLLDGRIAAYFVLSENSPNAVDGA